MILYIKHIDIEGPGTLGDFFEAKRIPSRTIDLGRGGMLPDSYDGIDAVISLGGPMNVYEEDQFPFLKEENKFIQGVIEREIPFMGLCLGSQLLAKAAGAGVGKSPVSEIGFYPAMLTKEGKKDPLFRGLEETLEVFQWHNDMFNIPKEGSLLAISKGCPRQAFKIGSCAYGLQFHVEITDLSIIEWSDRYIKKNQECADMKEKMLRSYDQKKEKFNKVAERIYNNFLQIMVSQKVVLQASS